MAGNFLPWDVFHFRETQKVAKIDSLCVQTVDDGDPDEGGLWYSDIHNQEMNRSDSDSETEDSTLRSGRDGPRLDENGKSKAGNKGAGEKLQAGRSF